VSYRILSIMPAPDGWHALFVGRDWQSVEQIVALAMVERDDGDAGGPYTQVEPLVRDPESQHFSPAGDIEGFLDLIERGQEASVPELVKLRQDTLNHVRQGKAVAR